VRRAAASTSGSDRDCCGSPVSPPTSAARTSSCPSPTTARLSRLPSTRYLVDIKTLTAYAITAELIDGKNAAVFKTDDHYACVVMPLTRERG
jgi:hypothetical protein